MFLTSCQQNYTIYFVLFMIFKFCFYILNSGLSPAEADFSLLDTARKVEFYGIRLHPARVII